MPVWFRTARRKLARLPPDEAVRLIEMLLDEAHARENALLRQRLAPLFRSRKTPLVLRPEDRCMPALVLDMADRVLPPLLLKPHEQVTGGKA